MTESQIEEMLEFLSRIAGALEVIADAAEAAREEDSEDA
jgi:hypothetical protein